MFVQVTFPLVVAPSCSSPCRGTWLDRRDVRAAARLPLVVDVGCARRRPRADRPAGVRDRLGGIGTDVVVLMLLTGLLIGFVEELTYRGLAVKMLRDGGHGEWVVVALRRCSSPCRTAPTCSAASPSPSSAPPSCTRFGFGILMYLSMRVIGFLAGAMILHGLTDPTTFLATGGIDKVGDGGTTNDVLSAAGLVTFPLVIIGLVLLIFIRGRSPGQEEAEPRTA